MFRRPMSWAGCGAHGNKQHLCHTGAFNWTMIADDLPGLQLATVLPSSRRPRLERRSETVLLGQFFIILQLSIGLVRAADSLSRLVQP